MKRLSIIMFSLLVTFILNAQNETDALRYSQIFPAGSARFAGLGGAFGAIGADFSTLSFNPAGYMEKNHEKRPESHQEFKRTSGGRIDHHQPIHGSFQDVQQLKLQ